MERSIHCARNSGGGMPKDKSKNEVYSVFHTSSTVGLKFLTDPMISLA